MQQEVLRYAGMFTFGLLVSGFIQFRKTGKPEGVKRPGWVWAILVYYILLVPFAYVMLVAAVSPEANGQHVPQPVNAFDFASYTFVVFASVIGAAFMFWFRRESVNIFIAILAVMILRTAWGFYLRASVQPTAFVGIAVTTAVVLYGRRIAQEGVLR